MSKHPDIIRVLIIGGDVSAWLPAAMLAARLPKNIYEITVCDTGDGREDTLLARPYICRAHDLIGIDDQALAHDASARPVHAYKVERETGEEICLPFGEYGYPHQGAAFNHYWLRVAQTGQARALADYNLALRLTEAGGFLGKVPSGLPFLDYGYELSRRRYVALLRRIAMQSGVKDDVGAIKNVTIATPGLIENVTLERAQLTPDLTLCFGGEDLPIADQLARIDECLNGFFLETPSGLPGLALHQLQTCTMRLLTFWPSGAFTLAEKTELKRLQKAETDLINDMAALLEYGPEAAKNSRSLRRKCQVYAARGRIPTEDYEVFSKPEWLAALSAGGIVPRSYDRLVDRQSLSESVAFVAQTVARIDQLLDRSKQKRRAV